MADMNRENPAIWNSPTESEETLGEKPGSYLKKKKGLLGNLQGTSATEAEGFCYELSRC